MGSKTIYKYDSRGNKIEEADYNSDGSLDDKTIYKYDLRGNKIEEAKYNSDGPLDRKYTYKYDSRGNMIERTDGEGRDGIELIVVYDITYRD